MLSCTRSTFGSFHNISVGLLTDLSPLLGPSRDPGSPRRTRTHCCWSLPLARAPAWLSESVSIAQKSLCKRFPSSALFRETAEYLRSLIFDRTPQSLLAARIHPGPL